MEEKDERNLPIPEESSGEQPAQEPNQESEKDEQRGQRRGRPQKPERTNSIVTRESVSAVFAMFSILAFVILLTDSAVFMEPGAYIHALLLGVFGYMAYPLAVIAIYNCIMGFLGKKLFKKRKVLTWVIITAVLLALVIHTVQTCYIWDWPQEGYLSACFNSGDEFPATTVAGWLGALLVFLLVVLTTEVGALVILSTAALLSVYATAKVIVKNAKKSSGSAPKDEDEPASQQPVPHPNGQQPYAPNGQPYAPNGQQYAPNGQPYAPNGQPYAPNGQPYAPNGQPYAPSGQQYTPSEQPYTPNGQPTPEQSAVPPMPGYTQSGVAPQSMGGYTPFMPYTVRQRPGFTLPNQNAQSAPQTPHGQLQQGQPQGNAYPTQGSGYPVDSSAPAQPAQSPAAQAPAQPAQPTAQSPFGTSYSPFGSATSRQQIGQSLSAEESRRILFSGTPKQNYQDNLIFDGNASVHRRTSSMGVPATSAPYSEQYQQSVQNASASRPQKVVGESTSTFGGRASGSLYELDVPSSSTASAGRSVDTEQRLGGYPRENATPWNTGTQTPSYDGSPSGYGTERRGASDPYPTMSDTRRDIAETPYAGNTFSTETRRGMMETPRVGISGADVPPITETPRTSAVELPTDSGRRHDYMDLFSPQNPRIFGASGNRPDPEEKDEVAATDRSAIFEDDTVSSSDTATRGLGVAREDDPYALRSYEERSTGSARLSPAETLPGRTSTAHEMYAETASTPVAEESFAAAASTRVGFVSPAPASGEKAQEEPAVAKPKIRKPYVRVPLHYFNCSDNLPDSDVMEVEDIKRRIIETLEDYNVSGGTIASVTFGPTVTRYNVVLPRGVSPRKVVSLEQEIAMGLCREGVNVYPNVEDGAVSIEVPNKNRQTVELGCMFIDDAYTKAKPTSLVFAMGKDIANRKVYGDVCKMTHLLVAGSSGSGKSVFLGCLIISLITKYSPDEMRLILIDPKKTEFVLYNGLPHLMVNEIITDCKKAVQSLSWAIGEMERRYSLIEKKSLSGTYVVNIDEYNANLAPGEEKLPKIVIIVDELADLMLNAKKDMEDKIQSLTQKARAAGIHLILATQRPSTDVITGVIKSNLPTRIAFTVATDVDSRVILDQTGAQKLLGKGDMVYTASGINTPVRVQSPFISSSDSQKVVNFIKENNEAYFDESASTFINNTRTAAGGEGGDASGGDVEPVYLDALKLVIQTQTASISMLQRKCSIGFNKAGKIIEWMEMMEFISPYEGAKARRVLITREKFIELYGEW